MYATVALVLILGLSLTQLGIVLTINGTDTEEDCQPRIESWHHSYGHFDPNHNRMLEF